MFIFCCWLILQLQYNKLPPYSDGACLTCHLLHVVDPLVLHGFKVLVSRLVAGVPQQNTSRGDNLRRKKAEFEDSQTTNEPTERRATRAATHLWGEVSGGLDGGLDPLHRALVGGADGGGLLCCGAQLVGVVLEVGGPVLKDLHTIRAARLHGPLPSRILSNETSDFNIWY